MQRLTRGCSESVLTVAGIPVPTLEMTTSPLPSPVEASVSRMIPLPTKDPSWTAPKSLLGFPSAIATMPCETCVGDVGDEEDVEDVGVEIRKGQRDACWEKKTEGPEGQRMPASLRWIGRWLPL